jgi:hypothetical protein
LARGQILRHTFRFTNKSRGPCRVTGATALTPCCSEIGPIPPGAIQPGETCDIPTLLKVGTEKAMDKRVWFVVQTDDNDRPKETYSLQAAIYPEWEVDSFGEPLPHLSRGHSGRVSLRVISRDAAGAPDRLAASAELSATFVGEAGQATTPNAFTTSHRDVEVILPPSATEGFHSGLLTFRWSDGRTRDHRVSWVVSPSLRISPSRLAVAESDRGVAHSIAIRSGDRPFRILRVEPPSLVVSSEYSPDAAASHMVVFRLNHDRLAGPKSGSVLIHTDHPDDGVLTLPVSFLSAGR